jgi:poly-gamma-glutamate synthesis protein (capsule biosynthesis protein)
VVAALTMVGCRGAASTETSVPSTPVPATASAARSSDAGCDPRVPIGACSAFRAALAGRTGDVLAPLAPCRGDAPTRIGEWRYALVAPLDTPTEDVRDDQLAALWRGDDAIALTATADTALALGLGSHRAPPLAVGARPTVDATHWAIVPADELVPQWRVVTVAGHHPLAPVAAGALVVPLCANGARVAVRNLDPVALTTLAMTGVTAMVRGAATTIDREGTAAVRDIASWFDGIDVVHVSNEVSFVPGCQPEHAPFCARERTIELLDAIHTTIVELDGSHLDDPGSKWMAHTLDVYDARGWKHFGGGRDQLDATRPTVVEHHGNRLAFVGCNMPHSSAHTIRNRPDVAYCDRARLDWQVRDLRRRGYFPIVSIQHEEVYRHDPPDLLVRDFRHLAEVGAAIVFGSQAHVAHPFEVHDGAFVHYGAGNLFFDQVWPGARDAAADRFYIYRGRLLTVGHLYTRLDEPGHPRPMTAPERAEFLRALAAARAKLPPARPWAEPRIVPPAAAIPDSLLVGTDAVLLSITPPDPTGDHADAGRAPLVIDLGATPARDPAAFTVSLRRRASPPRLAAAIAAFMVAKYSTDPDRVTVR